MYLSRLILDPRHRDTRRWLADCHQLHQVIMSAFPATPGATARAELGVLFRVETGRADNLVHVLVQSGAEPRWAVESAAIVAVDGPRDIDAASGAILPGRRFRFRLRANPTRRVHQRAALGADDARLNAEGMWKDASDVPDELWNGAVRRRHTERPDAVGKRVEIRGEEERIAWLQRQGARCGFALTQVSLVDRPLPASRADPGGTVTGARRASGDPLTFGTALFEGELEVTDAAALLAAWRTGIGPGKAFGCGLLSLAPVTPM